MSAVVRRAAVLAVCLALPVTSPSAAADPLSQPVGAASAADGAVPPGVPARVTTPDGWTLALGARDEKHVPVAPLTTAASSREYLSSGIFVASLTGPETPHGILEVGYEIGCGIDMSTANGVTMANGGGVSPSLGAVVPFGPGEPFQLLPLISTPYNGVVSVGMKPGFVVVVPVVRKEFKGPNPWIMISEFHMKIDGCVGQSFVRSYSTLTRITDESDVVLSYVGATKAV
ncbi:MspA family porin [Mycobacterium asiaticum]|uniref:MspA protein n=1 Tax=Mycobacterium asiaticum TaxID=1790 RepID=A0A1A3KS87_MYCAS|nr:MspA family porin [Mycobacterium asiaticum]OBI85752.1 MspA protein [Mycobacterium asiaticum]OBJ50399.1 MspA protein [Mycobacterium asiaticum]OBJ87238.1 MspA protein [Mycobacterium asiaticum]ORA08677.1 MspA protein [Mycobacterium asiaticum DSM 44297]